MKPSQSDLRLDYLARFQSHDARAAFEYLLSHASGLRDYDCRLRNQGYLRTFQYKQGSKWPYGFIVNQADILFYIRRPGQGNPALNASALSLQFSDVSTQASGGEVKVRLSNAEDAGRLIRLVFSGA